MRTLTSQEIMHIQGGTIVRTVIDVLAVGSIILSPFNIYNSKTLYEMAFETICLGMAGFYVVLRCLEKN